MLGAVAVIAGLILIAAILGDAIGTLIVTRGRTGRFRPTRLWYTLTWRTARASVVVLPARGAEIVLNVYPALSLLGLLVVWLCALVLGWTLVYWGLGGTVAGSGDFGSLVYYSGTSIIAAQFGVASGAAVRALSLIETLTGLGTIALLISYLPALYGAYSRREAKLLTLDDTRAGRLTPVRALLVHAPGGDVESFYRFCSEWEDWTAEVLESHVSYPMLALFRSQHAGQSWITALGVILDMATLACVCIPGADQREPYFLHRRGRRAVIDIASRVYAPPDNESVTWLTRENFQIAWDSLRDAGIPLTDEEEAFSRLLEQAATYRTRLQDLIDYLLAPHGFWGHSSEATVDEEVARAQVDARLRARRRTRGSAAAAAQSRV